MKDTNSDEEEELQESDHEQSLPRQPQEETTQSNPRTPTLSPSTSNSDLIHRKHHPSKRTPQTSKSANTPLSSPLSQELRPPMSSPQPSSPGGPPKDPPQPNYSYYVKLKKFVRSIPTIVGCYYLTCLINPDQWWAVHISIVVIVLSLRFYFISNPYVSQFLTISFGLLLFFGIVAAFALFLVPTTSSNISKKLYGQDTVVKLYVDAIAKKKNLFLLVGPSGVGKTLFADVVASENRWLQQKNIYNLRLSDLSPKHIAMFVQDVEQLFNKKNRNSIAYFVEVECKAPGCVVVLDDFHVFSGLLKEESAEVIRRLETYASEHKEIIFMLVVETTSIMSIKKGSESLDKNSVINHANLIRDYLDKIPTDKPVDDMVKHIDDIIKQRVVALQNANYTLLPFSSLSANVPDKKLLIGATRKKLEEGARNVFQILRQTNRFIEFSSELVEKVCLASFSDLGGGMRTLNNYWFPITYETIKFKCPPKCPLLHILYIEEINSCPANRINPCPEWQCSCEFVISSRALNFLMQYLVLFAQKNEGFLKIMLGLIRDLFA